MKINYLIWHSIKSQLWFKTHNDEKNQNCCKGSQKNPEFHHNERNFFPLLLQHPLCCISILISGFETICFEPL